MKKIHILYKLNRYDLEIPLEGLPAEQVLQQICAKLSLNPGRFHLRQNNEQISNLLLFPLQSIELCSIEPIKKPSLSKCLWQMAIQARQEQTLLNLANECFEEIVNRMERVASCGLFEITIELESLEAWKWVPSPLLVERVKSHLKTRLNNEQLHPRILGPTKWSFQWKQEEIVMPLITGRDLVHMGYVPGALFETILNQLRGAIIEGVVAGDIRDAQLNWVRSSFPTSPNGR